MNLNSIPAFDDNYIWVLNDEAGRCLIVDPGDAEPVLNAIAANTFCKVTDSLAVARKMFPGKRNSLDALCARYEIDNSKRTLHGALLDAQILAEVYLAMTGGQTSMAFAMEGETQQQQGETTIQRIVRQASKLRVVFATDEELAAHEARLDLVQKKGGSCLWRA